MKHKSLSQEGLKLIACVTMLLDHLGASMLLPGMGLRVIGRLAFPIYCFLMSEGLAHTRDPKRYGLRLMLGALLAEIPFDLLFYGRFSWQHQSVMVTLLLGFLMVMWARKLGSILLPFAVCFFGAEVLGTDYGGIGVALIALFVITRERKHAFALRVAGMAVLMLLMGSVEISVGIVNVPIQMFALLAMIPIWFYSGRKATANAWIQTAFYLFYPAHLLILLLIVRL